MTDERKINDVDDWTRPFAAEGEEQCAAPHMEGGAPCQRRRGHDVHLRRASGGADGWIDAYAVMIAEAEARVRAEVAEEIKIVLNQRVTHAHMRPGIWDDDNISSGLANTRCVECAARDRLAAFAAGSSRDISDPGLPLRNFERTGPPR